MTSPIPVHPAIQTQRRAGVFSIAILGADAILAAQPATPVQLAHGCLRAGYGLAVPASWGDELIAGECLTRLAERGARPAVMCSCPHVRSELLAVGPDLGPMLIPLVAPPVAVARYLHQIYGRDRIHLTYIGNCPAAADDALNVHLVPADFLAALAASGIVLTEQPTVFDSVLPPDRRRFLSIAGGVPSAEQLWSAGNGRSLVELDGEDYLIDLAQHLLSHQCALIDLAPRLGCACSGVSAQVPARSARAAVAVMEPPRASSAVIDAGVTIELSDPIPCAAIVAAEGPEGERTSVEHHSVGRDDQRATLTEDQGPEPAPPSSTATSHPRRRSPSAGIRSIQRSVPVAHVSGRRLPRAYIGSRRVAPAAQAPEPVPALPDIPRMPPATIPDSVGDDIGRSRAPARVAASARPPGGTPAAAVAAGASGGPERMSDGPPS
jgi:hypothetical protein